jgi:hypothetical protein
VQNVIALWVCFFPSFFDFTLIISIPPLFRTHLSQPLEVRDGSDQTAHYHITLRGVISVQALGWLQSDGVG